MLIRRTAVALTSAAVLAVLPVAAAPAGAEPSFGPCTAGPKAVVINPGPRDWAPLTPSRWELGRNQIAQVERGTAPPGPRRPFEYAVLTKGPELASIVYHAQVRIDEPVTRNDRDVILVYAYEGPTRFSYVHLSQDNTIYPHNGIFTVQDADRLRIDDQWNGSVGAPPAIDDTDWHDVTMTYCAATGQVRVWVDGTLLMTATDTSRAGGRVGFGSFDNYGRMRNPIVLGTRLRR